MFSHMWEPWCPRKRAEQQAVKKRFKITKFVILLKYTTFFPIKEEPQDQHKDLGCYMMFSISELICVPGAKAAQLCRSCCGCFQAVRLAGTEQRSCLQQHSWGWKARLCQGISNHWRPCYARQAFQLAAKSSEKQLLVELPQDTPALLRAFRNQERTFTTYLCYCII